MTKETMIYYTGIGSRQTPEEVLEEFTATSKWLENKFNGNITLRSGGADGADTAFEMGAINKEIFLPWKGFNNNNSELYNILPKAFEIAENIHPAWHKCSQGARKLHARNIHQILGRDLKTFSRFVICYTPNGSSSGGTGQAIRLAKQLNIPIFDFGLYDSRAVRSNKLVQFIDNLKLEKEE